MALSVLDRSEINLNSIKFKLGGDGRVHLFYASQFAQKQVIGDYTKDSDPNRSTWTIYSDQTGGIGVEDLRPEHTNRSWWSTINTDYPGNGFLGKLATAGTMPTLPTITDGELDVWDDVNNLTNWPETINGNASLTRIAAIKSGTYAARLATVNGAGTYVEIAQTLSNWSNNFRGKLITISVWANCSGEASGFIQIADGVGATNTNFTMDSVLRQYFVTRTLDAAATGITVTIKAGALVAAATTIDCDLVEIAAIGGITPRCDFNSNSYFSSGAILLKLDATTGAFLLEGIFPATITDVIAGVNSCLYVFLGDSDEYWYITTAGVFTETNVANAYKGVHWGNKLCKINTSGAFTTTSTPNSATPTWDAKGTVDTGSQGAIMGLVTYVSDTGTDIVYCATDQYVLAHDNTNSLWLNTELKVAKHTDNGKGFAVQNGALYYSSGLAVYEYKLVGGSLTITNMGLDLDDGLPDEYVGSIVKLIAGYGGKLYALVDASLISSSNYSVLFEYENGTWKVVWADGTANEAMTSALVTSVYAYRLWFGAGSTLYYMAQDRSRRNPLKITTSYAASGKYISPWFDGLWAGNKLALAVRALARATSADETIAIKYRIDKTNLTVASGWTTLYTLVAADAGVEKISTFASSVGLSFKTIQFGLDFARAAGTATNTPNLIYCVLEYEKLITAKWGWAFTVDCSETYANLTPQQQRDAIITLVESATLVPFYYGGPSEPRYVRVKPAEGERLTGQASQGIYRLVAIEK